jgi:hypothetical protein
MPTFSSISVIVMPQPRYDELSGEFGSNFIYDDRSSNKKAITGDLLQ